MQNIKAKIEKIEVAQEEIRKLNKLSESVSAMHTEPCLSFEANNSAHGLVVIDNELFNTALTGQILILENSISGDVKFVQAVELMISSGANIKT